MTDDFPLVPGMRSIRHIPDAPGPSGFAIPGAVEWRRICQALDEQRREIQQLERIAAMEETEEVIDTTNWFMLAGNARDKTLCFLKPCPRELSTTDALLLAAWLVAMVGDEERWLRFKEAVENT